MRTKIYSIVILLFLFSGLVFISCNRGDSKSHRTVKNRFMLDTTKYLKVANFVHSAERKKIISEETFLPDGSNRNKGLSPIPQDGDDFRSTMLSNVQFNGAHLQEADFSGADLEGCYFFGAEITILRLDLLSPY